MISSKMRGAAAIGTTGTGTGPGDPSSCAEAQFNKTYVGCEGHGAELRSAGAEPRPIRVAQNSAQPVRVVGSRSHRGASLDAFIENLGDCTLVPMGSSLKFCVVAEGGADVYPRLGPTSEWDTAAAQAVVEQAGGAQARVEKVAIEDVAVSRSTRHDGALDLRAQWTALGQVGHWGHVHSRQNRYDARVTVVPVGESWKIQSIEIRPTRPVSPMPADPPKSWAEGAAPVM